MLQLRPWWKAAPHRHGPPQLPPPMCPRCLCSLWRLKKPPKPENTTCRGSSGCSLGSVLQRLANGPAPHAAQTGSAVLGRRPGTDGAAPQPTPKASGVIHPRFSPSSPPKDCWVHSNGERDPTIRPECPIPSRASKSKRRCCWEEGDALEPGIVSRTSG